MFFFFFNKANIDIKIYVRHTLLKIHLCEMAMKLENS